MKREHVEEKLVAYGEGGATRSKQKAAYHLIPAISHEAEGVRYFIGEEKHGEGNWKHGDKQFVKQFFNHIQCHVTDLLKIPSGENKEGVFENVGAIKWGASGILWYATYKPEIFKQALEELQEGLAESK